MKKLLLAAGLLFNLPALAVDISLEGVSILGKNKTAYLLVNGGKQGVKIGDTVTEWKVVNIAPRAVMLQNAQGIERQIGLYSQKATEALDENVPAATAPESKAVAESESAAESAAEPFFFTPLEDFPKSGTRLKQAKASETLGLYQMSEKVP